jgi:UDP-N-acetylmuramyl pentapeptide synthase
MNFKETAEGQIFDLEIEKKIKSQKTELFGMHNVYALAAAQTVSNEIEKFIKNRK